MRLGRLLIFGFLFLLISGDLLAIGTILGQNQNQAMRDSLRERMPDFGDRLQLNRESPEGCRREEVVSSRRNDPMLDLRCIRTICGGHFWGESALDSCCERQTVTEELEGGMTREYRRCYYRAPKQRRAREEWQEIPFLIRGPVELCGNDLLSPDEIEGLRPSSLLDSLVSTAFASEVLRIATSEWTEAERREMATVLKEVGNRIDEALNTGNITEVGPEGSLIREYIYSTLSVVRYLSHTLVPSDPEFPCPADCLGNLCPMTDNNFYPVWITPEVPCSSGHCILGETDALNVIATNQEFSVSRLPAARGIVAQNSSHEAAHALFYYIHGNYTFDTTNPVYDFGGFENIHTQLENEMTARAVGAIVYHFLPDAIRNSLPPQHIDIGTRLEARYELLLHDPLIGLMQLIEPYAQGYYIVNFYRRHLLGAEWQRVESCVVDTLLEHPELNTADPVISSQLFGECIARRVGSQNLQDLILTLINQILDSGGPVRLSCLATAGIPPEAPMGPSQHHHDMVGCSASSDPFGEEVACDPLEGDPPPDDSDGPGQGDRTAPGDDTGRAPDCVTFYQRFQTESPSSITSSCYQWCWNHAHTNPGLCQLLRDNDVTAGCSLSGGDSHCNNALEDSCVANPREVGCLDLCEADSGRDHCDDLCRLEYHDYCFDFCREAREAGRTPPSFCFDACESADIGAAFCHEYCEDDEDPEFCGRICQSSTYADEDFCRRRCSNADFTSHPSCPGVCEAHGWTARNNVWWCNEACEANPDTSYCQEYNAEREEMEEERRRAEEEAARREDEGDGCSRGWTYRRGSVPVTNDGCFPFVGNIKCCGSNCEPDGANQACTDTGWCGCDPDPDLSSYYNSCLRPDSSDWDEAMLLGDSEDLFYHHAAGAECIRGLGAASNDECVCVGAGLPIYCYPNNSSIPERVRGRCCYDTGACVTRSSLGLP
ncbi:MAG: hypothetical protein HYT76_07835 [Deltaproteobacteria bacterium]|nr:hypothetical protein [Deltaproteobacteria bacterium]